MITFIDTCLCIVFACNVFTILSQKQFSLELRALTVVFHGIGLWIGYALFVSWLEWHTLVAVNIGLSASISAFIAWAFYRVEA